MLKLKNPWIIQSCVKMRGTILNVPSSNRIDTEGELAPSRAVEVEKMRTQKPSELVVSCCKKRLSNLSTLKDSGMETGEH